MNKTDSDWEFDHIFNQPEPGLKLQRFITYRVVDGKMKKTLVTRKFYGDKDYQDSVTSEIID